MNELTGTWPLIRLILRRDRFILPIWILWLAIIPVLGIASFNEVYPTVAARESFARLAQTNLAFTALYGKLYGSSIGALIAWRYSVIGVWAALASFLTVIRHTRTEEEAGRRELLGSTVVGRYAPLSAALIVAFGANLVLAVLIAALSISQELSAAGSIALGLSFAAPGFIFASVGALCAQLTKNVGSARGIAGSVLGLAFLLRAVGDVGENSGLSWISWMSPLGWALQMRPFTGEHFWILALVLGAFALLAGVAYMLSSRRDIGAGILPERLGPATASPGFRSPLALAWRLQRNLLIGWTIGITVYGIFVGGVIHALADMIRDNPQLETFFASIGGEAGLTDLTIAAMVAIVGLVISIYAVQAVLKMRGEEVSRRTDPVLATSIGRLRYATSHLVFAIVGSAGVLAVGGLSAGLTYGLITSEVGREVGRVLGAAMVHLPAIWVLAAIAIALFGLLPRFAASGAWGALAAFLVIGLFGELLQLPQWTLDISPFNHIPKLPSGEFTIVPIIWLLAIAAVLTVAGLVGFRQRDISRA